MSADKLIPLDEFNATIRRSFHDWTANLPQENGIACPKCSAELLDTTPNQMLASLPPQKAVHCRKCGWRGHRLA